MKDYIGVPGAYVTVDAAGVTARFPGGWSSTGMTRVITSIGRRYFACWDRDQRSLGAVTDVRAVSDQHVAYRRGDKVGVLDASSGARVELPGTQSAATSAMLLAAGPSGVSTATARLSTGAASAPALADGRAYRLDAAKRPQTQALMP